MAEVAEEAVIAMLVYVLPGMYIFAKAINASDPLRGGCFVVGWNGARLRGGGW